MTGESEDDGFYIAMMAIMFGVGLIVGLGASSEHRMVREFCDHQDQGYEGGVGYGPGETFYIECERDNGTVESYKLRTWSEWKDRKVTFDFGESYVNKTLSYEEMVVPDE